MTTSEYMFISGEEKDELRRQRIRALEAEHCRISIMAEECAHPEEKQAAAADIAEVERRIAMHYRVLNGEEQTEPSVVAADELVARS